MHLLLPLFLTLRLTASFLWDVNDVGAPSKFELLLKNWVRSDPSSPATCDHVPLQPGNLDSNHFSISCHRVIQHIFSVQHMNLSRHS